jgi:hypothetical protein
MKRIEFETKLRQVKNASLARVRMLVQDLEPHAPRVDAVLREDFRKTLERLGFTSPTLAAVSLLPRETWLLLYEAPRDGWAVRLRAFYDAVLPTIDDRLATEVRRAHRGLLADPIFRAVAVTALALPTHAARRLKKAPSAVGDPIAASDARPRGTRRRPSDDHSVRGGHDDVALRRARFLRRLIFSSRLAPQERRRPPRCSSGARQRGTRS